MLPRLLSDLSQWTWRFLRDAPFRPREETITEVLLTELTRRGGSSVRIVKSSVAEENRDGLDWAWAIRTSAGWVHFLVQAKQASGQRFAAYRELRKREASSQAQRLIHAAAMADAAPLYVFYNPELPPFGAERDPIRLGACTNGRRLSRGSGLPWSSAHESPAAVTVVHAEDIVDHVLDAPASRQRATNVNEWALPWECLLCPGVEPTAGTAGQPRVNSVAVLIRQAVEAMGDGLQALASPEGRPWITPEAPPWAQELLSGREPTQVDGVPEVNYFVVIDSLDRGQLDEAALS